MNAPRPFTTLSTYVSVARPFTTGSAAYVSVDRPLTIVSAYVSLPRPFTTCSAYVDVARPFTTGSAQVVWRLRCNGVYVAVFSHFFLYIFNVILYLLVIY